MKWIALLAVSLVWTAQAFAETGSRFTTSVQIDASLVMAGIALVALLVPFLYDGSLFTRQRVWKRRFKKNAYRTSAYYAERHGEIQGQRDPLDKEEVRRKARRSL